MDNVKPQVGDKWRHKANSYDAVTIALVSDVYVAGFHEADARPLCRTLAAFLPFYDLVERDGQPWPPQAPETPAEKVYPVRWCIFGGREDVCYWMDNLTQLALRPGSRDGEGRVWTGYYGFDDGYQSTAPVRMLSGRAYRATGAVFHVLAKEGNSDGQ